MLSRCQPSRRFPPRSSFKSNEVPFFPSRPFKDSCLITYALPKDKTRTLTSIACSGTFLMIDSCHHCSRHNMAGVGGFEPPDPLRDLRVSNPLQSTTLPYAHIWCRLLGFEPRPDLSTKALLQIGRDRWNRTNICEFRARCSSR